MLRFVCIAISVFRRRTSGPFRRCGWCPSFPPSSPDCCPLSSLSFACSDAELSLVDRYLKIHSTPRRLFDGPHHDCCQGECAASVLEGFGPPHPRNRYRRGTHRGAPHRFEKRLLWTQCGTTLISNSGIRCQLRNRIQSYDLPASLAANCE